MYQRFSAALALGAALLVGSGCSGEKGGEVSGKVTYNDAPVEEGEIVFEAIDGNGSPAAGAITSGYYTVATTPGPKRVRISALKASGKVDPVMGTAPKEPMIPKEYNSESKLTAEVKSGKHQGVNFDLKGKS
ncbi:hypothetical protein [Gemmata sp.]|uniref:hypothetical protein n=1 Tax=Gemmata sp. TaxID=1914242 RepID=UPI003F7093B3